MKTNTYQSNYLLAKANLETLHHISRENEKQFIIENEIKNPDGSTPNAIWCIDNDVLFEKYNMEYGKLVESNGEQAKTNNARKALEIAEKELIEFALKIIPNSLLKEKEVLQKAAKHNCKVRQEIIDLILRLDTSTVN